MRQPGYVYLQVKVLKELVLWLLTGFSSSIQGADRSLQSPNQFGTTWVLEGTWAFSHQSLHSHHNLLEQVWRETAAPAAAEKTIPVVASRQWNTFPRGPALTLLGSLAKQPIQLHLCATASSVILLLVFISFLSTFCYMHEWAYKLDNSRIKQCYLSKRRLTACTFPMVANLF